MIREATKSDSVNMAALAIQVWLHTYATDGLSGSISRHVLSTYTQQYFEEIIDDPRFRALVSVDGENLRAFTLCDLESHFGDESNGYEIDILYVQEHFQGCGLGRGLLAAVEERYGAPFWLTTWVYNTRAIDFYTRYGFVDIGRVDFDLEGEKHENRVLAFQQSS